MKLSQLSLLAVLVVGALGDLHYSAYCRGKKQPWGFDKLNSATKCACDRYKNRHTGLQWWDSCPDCTFDGTNCRSNDRHIGGDEMHYYCTSICGADGSEAD
ncbi:hypothetical protein LCI18_012915 [Fusarium solani-melongenae]|uniref:Uncharacterized protein n=1 Tax=Fusarium solani subsp. cucurbitae TaxID=2747967 RepID=A0ACD3ZLK2_FUSSC|nr:hypothetical protein LCI18_012915 [Fusarium solani-melongenae]